MRLSLKILSILLLASAIFGGAWYWTYDLFIRPKKLLEHEKTLPPPPPPLDVTLPEFEKAMAPKRQGNWIEARAALQEFVENYGDSTKLDEAREALGEVNTRLVFSPAPAPEKVLYVVRSGDVLNKVAARTRTTPELIMKANHLTGTMLRVDQKLWVPPTAFSVLISRKRDKVVLQNNGGFFKQYAIRSWPPQHGKKVASGPLPKLTGRVTGKLAWVDGQRVIFTDKGYEHASHWIQWSIPGYTLYGEPVPGDAAAQKPPAGIALAPEAMPELAALLRKNDPVTLE